MGNTTGHISVARLLDYETRSSYNLMATATDGGGRESSSSVTITVLDVNDNPPEFTQASYSANVDENVILGHSVVQVGLRLWSW